ncbi:MAG: ComEC family competence protein [Firmicutes bacterium ADurb.Bin080]|nr:MAG: ComEC family competence protein [Firmicutes bacterium ADurb.Bin080]
MSLRYFIQDIMNKYQVNHWRDTWIVDDIIMAPEKKAVKFGLNEELFWVKLVRVDDLEPSLVGYFLANAKLVSNNNNDDEYQGQIGVGMAFDIDWNNLYHVYYRRHSSDRGHRFVRYLDTESISLIRRNHDVEGAIQKEYQEILEEVQGKDIPKPRYLGEVIDPKDQKINLHVMNVGQGDTIVLRFPDNRIWMIDAYLHKDPRVHITYFVEFVQWLHCVYPDFIFERLILSHMHYDHIMSAANIIDSLSPESVIVARTPIGLTSTALKLHKKALNNKILNELTISETVNLGNWIIRSNLTSCLANKASSRDQNHHGIILDLRSDKSHLLLPGDASWDQIDDFLSNQYNTIQNLERYYKVTHHCSHTGYDANFLGNYHPKYAFTSCSNGNRYGHPDPVTRVHLDRITNEHVITWKHKRKSIDREIQ